MRLRFSRAFPRQAARRFVLRRAGAARAGLKRVAGREQGRPGGSPRAPRFFGPTRPWVPRDAFRAGGTRSGVCAGGHGFGGCRSTRECQVHQPHATIELTLPGTPGYAAACGRWRCRPPTGAPRPCAAAARPSRPGVAGVWARQMPEFLYSTTLLRSGQLRSRLNAITHTVTEIWRERRPNAPLRPY